MALKNYALNSVAVSQETDLVVPAADKEFESAGLIICNNEATNVAAILVRLTTSANASKGMIWRGTLAAGEPFFVDSKVVIAASASPDKVRVISDQANVSFIFSGDES
ncbi:hypothetical protein NNJEOMEG_03301 [Fundidesulfovibrio magnetotacticus]|uniref:Uncharacterized protein n=1 Tax=Fundidesulfovibrio magnetotacticus TaxID=2730080 RepID=A0A6V8LYX7_9BACT|nr:amidohydrolase [Fundidesulfovibrio magnetotacticus]GFK95438.1 hypothetical protein NNJEOMEG_03301 [Fundidesulfovibrio magnetotacticus]